MPGGIVAFLKSQAEAALPYCAVPADRSPTGRVALFQAVQAALHRRLRLPGGDHPAGEPRHA